MVSTVGARVRRWTMGLGVLTSLIVLALLGRTIFRTQDDWQGSIVHITSYEGGGFPHIWRVDGLSAFFLFLLLLGQGILALYAWGYLREYEGRKNLGVFALYWLAFVGSMFGVLVAADGFTFLFMWELMSIFSFLLVLYENETRAARKAAYIYLTMTHLGTVFLTAAFLFLAAQTGSYSFDSWAHYAPQLSADTRNILFLCFLLGFGTKAGLVPLHIWLPYAHSQAPSPVSGLMSGVMVKVALYGFLRFAWVILGEGPLWWSWLLLVLGVLTAFVGILYAAVEHDIKRVLAYSTVENVGILTIALGVAFLARSWHYGTGMALGLAAFFWHAVQHMLFKSLLFMGSGNVIQATHTRSLDRLGGLGRRLPQTGILALFGVLGLAALPPLGGFWGEWLLFNSLWQNAWELSEGWGKIVLPVIMALLGLIGALALAALVKWYGIVFLGQARSPEARNAVEVHPAQRAAMFAGVFVILLTVFWPQGILQLLNAPIAFLTGRGNWAELTAGMMPLGLTGSVMLYALLFAGTTGGLYLIMAKKRRRTATWNCGSDLTPRMQYSAIGVTKPIRVFFARILRSPRQVKKEFSGTGYVLHSLRYQGEVKAVFEDALYRPVVKLVLRLADLLKQLQTGNIHLYLGYLLLTLILVLMFYGV